MDEILDRHLQRHRDVPLRRAAGAKDASVLQDGLDFGKVGIGSTGRRGVAVGIEY